MNPFSGQWTTDLGGGVTGTVKFTALSESIGIQQLQAMGGHSCGAPTTYYHGDYTDTGGSGGDTGTMAACTASAGHLVGRYRNGNASLTYPGGGLDITLDSSQKAFSGFFTSDDPSLAGMTFPYSGTFQSHFPGDGCCGTTPPPTTTTTTTTSTSSGGGGNSGWLVGGGAEIRPPTIFCRFQRNFAARSAQAGGTPAPKPCVLPKELTREQKDEARADAKSWLLATAYYCTVASASPSSRHALRVINEARNLCLVAVQIWVETVMLVHDPPDRLFWEPPGRATAASFANLAAGSCPTGLSAAQCAALTTAVSNYARVTSLTAKVVGDIAVGANRVTAAVNAHSPASAYFQEAFAKINEGALAEDLVAERFYAQALAQLLNADHLGITVSASQVRSDLSTHPPGGLSSAQRKLLLGGLSSITGTLSPAALTAPFASSAYASQYRSISVTDLASVVNGLVANRDFSVAVGQRLVADLGNAQHACGDASRRIAAMQQFIADAHQQAASDAEFLRFGAQPLLASSVPASSCR